MLSDSRPFAVPTPKYTPLEEITTLCERIYESDGFVKWSEVAKLLGITRSAVQARLSKAVASGRLSEETYNKWRSVSSRLMESRRRLDLKRENERCRVTIVLTPANKKWIQEQCETRGCSSADLINGFITRERELNQGQTKR